MIELDNETPQDEIVEDENLENEQIDELEAGLDELESQENEETLDQPDQEIEEEIVPELPPLEPNALWTPEEKERFNTLDRETQQWMIDTSTNWQRGYNEKFQSLADERNRYESISQSMQPLQGYLQQNGWSVEQGVGIFSQHLQNIMSNPVNGAKTFLQSLGVDFNSLVNQEDSYIDPQVQELQTKLAQQEQMFNTYTQNQQSQVVQQQQGQINDFANQTNEQGHLAYPRFQELQQVMGQLMTSGMVQDGDLVAAYQKAEQLNPVQAPPMVNNDTQNQVKKAKVASKNIKSKGNTKSTEKLTQRQELEKGIEALM